MDMVGDEAKVRVAREKTWDEKSDSEKIDLLRRELRATKQLLMAMHKEFQKLSSHTHLASGEIAIWYYGAGAGEGGGPIGYNYDPLA